VPHTGRRCWGASAFLGPLIGSLFASYSSWRQVFWFFAILALLLAVWILSKVPDSPASTDEKKARFPNLADDNEKERIAAAIPTVHRAGYAIGAAYIGIIANTAQLDL